MLLSWVYKLLMEVANRNAGDETNPGVERLIESCLIIIALSLLVMVDNYGRNTVLVSTINVVARLA